MTKDHVRVLDANDSGQLARCFRVFAFLRPHLNEAEFMRRVRVQSSESYKIAFIELDSEIAAAAGYRVAHFLAWGRVLYIDDLITLPGKTRGGLGGALMDWLLEEGTRLDCDEVHLDTGFHRHDAHRLYLNKRLAMACHHLAKALAH
jgi:hypothetical protein